MSTRAQTRPLFDAPIVRRAALDALRKLDPRHMVRNPVMFVVEVGSAFTTAPRSARARDGAGRSAGGLHPRHRGVALVHGAVRELRGGDGRGPRQGAGRRAAPRATRRRRRSGCASRAATRAYDEVASPQLRKGDVVLVEAGEMIPADGEVIEGVASVNESAITGESAPVIRESGGDRSAVTGGTIVLSDWLVVRVTANPGETFLDRMIALVEGARRQKTPNEIALDILLAALTIVFLLATVTLMPFSLYAVEAAGAGRARHDDGARGAPRLPHSDDDRRPALGDRHRRHGPDDPGERDRDVGPCGRGGGRRRRAAARQDRHDHARQPRRPSRSCPRRGVAERELAEAAQLASLADETPEGRSIVVLAKAALRRARSRPARARRDLRPVHRPDAHERRRPRRAARSARARPMRSSASSTDAGGEIPGGGPRRRRAHRARGRDAARRRRRRARARRRPAQGHREGRHPRALRRAAPHGHPHRDDHRRQPAHRGGDRGRGGRRRLPRRGDARGQARADPRLPGEGTPGRDDGRRHQRRARARAGRRRRGDEHRHAGRQGSRQHGRPRLESDQAARESSRSASRC